MTAPSTIEIVKQLNKDNPGMFNPEFDYLTIVSNAMHDYYGLRKMYVNQDQEKIKEYLKSLNNIK